MVYLMGDVPAEEKAKKAKSSQKYVDTIFGEGFELAFDLESTDELINKHFRDTRANNPPSPISPFQCRIGLSTFYVPPIAIDVNTQFKSGALSTGALRRQNSPKFNTGNKETLISMTLYFPNFEEIYGTDIDRLNKSIHFEDSSDEEIDRFMSSLRGLVAQFKYAPFLPVRNAYLNQVHDITAVCMKNLSVANVPGFPGVLAVNLEMYKFNHEVYMPMVQDFNSAMHWGRYRAYCGRAMARIQNEGKGLNLWEDGDTIYDSEIRTGEVGAALKTPEQILAKYGFDYTDYGESISLAGPQSVDVRDFDFYYPFFVPSTISTPELEDLIAERPTAVEDKDWWDSTMEFLGMNDVNTDQFIDYETVRRMKLSTDDDSDSAGGFILDATEYQELLLYLEQTNLVLSSMSVTEREKFYQQRLREAGHAPGSSAAANLREQVKAAWSYLTWVKYTENVPFADMLADDERRRRNVNIEEWLVPMQKLNLDRRYVHIQDVSIRIGNKISRMQLQMQDEPTHQHLGGEDTVISISMIVTGGDPGAIGNLRDETSAAENQLIKLRTMFDTVSGIARLSHGHGTLGFLGVSNPMTELMGIKHVVPLNFDVRTIPNMPHSYMVTVELVDFDIMQQNRELLDPSQQAHLAEQFGKHNPFLRAKQNFSLFSAYPDFPLDVRDDDNKVVGYLNPSFYFRTFNVQDQGVVENDPDSPVAFNVGINPDGTPQQLLHYDDASIAVTNQNGEMPRGKIGDPDNIPSNTTVDPSLTPANRYQNAYRPGGLAKHIEDMSRDMAYRNKDGNMIRAFPTYMLWLIDESGHAAGIKLFDNFYGLQSVIDMSLSRSEDIMADTLMLRLSNLYSNLSTTFQNYLEEDEGDATARILNRLTTQLIRSYTGAGGWLLDVDSLNLRPGIRVHLRMGYSSDPRRLETVFNGKITEVHQGEIMTLVCQSDAVELGAIVNSTKKKGHSGKLDGSMDNLYLSEPRDLMVSLLSDGASAAKRVISHAARGEIFSENKYGIKHFGMMLYDTPNVEEEEKQAAREQTISSAIANHQTRKEEADDNSGFFDPAIQTYRMFKEGVDLRNDFFTNLAARRDFEIFKRNIYPGNSLGAGQFLGGDLGDIALNTAAGVVEGGGVNSDGTFRTDPVSGRTTGEAEQVEAEQPDRAFSPSSFTLTSSIGNLLGGVGIATGVAAETDNVFGRAIANIQETIGLRRSSSDQDVIPEVAFRAQTYMKTVWDLFKVCAAMMPDYIVAVRPFEDRSTVFYGKPHWMYTSGLIPITKGRELGKLPTVEAPDLESEDLFTMAREFTDAEITEGLQEAFSRATRYRSETAQGLDPNVTSVGMNFPGTSKSVLSYPTKRNGVSLEPEGKVAMEMHLPLSSNLQKDVENHKQIPKLKEEHRHPYYMDRAGGARGGEAGFSVGDQDTTLPGQPGAVGYIEDVFDTIEEAALAEQFYVNQRWKDAKGGSAWKSTWLHARILVLNPENGKAVVCTPIEYGPHGKTDRVAGLSPDAFYLLGAPHDKNCIFRVMPDDTPLGPVSFSAGGASPGDSTDKEKTKDEAADGETVTPEQIRSGYRPENEITAINFDATGKVYSDLEDIPEDEDFFVPSLLYGDFRTEEDAIEIWNFVRSDKYLKDGGGHLRYLGGGLTSVELTENGNHRQTMVDVIMTLNSCTEERAVKWLFEQDFSSQVEVYNKAVEADNDGHIVSVVQQALGIPDDQINDLESDDDVEWEDTRAWVLNDNFLRLMWQDPYARGWVVRVLDQDAFLDVGQSREFIYKKLDAIFANVYTTANQDYASLSSEVESEMRANLDQGRNNGGAVGDAYNLVKDTLGSLKDAVMSFAGGALGFIHASIMQMIGGVADAFNGEANSNILNKALDDSIYYAQGVDENGYIYDALQYYTDNPFTREYAEPVFEIREPFQRIHHIGSFQHILDNTVIEATTNVATIVTASSNDDQPVTVHFDKNGPIEDQVEKTVDTGLFLSEDGFFSRIWNPINSLRDWTSSTSGASISDNKLAERIAASHLKESLKDIYQGEIIILGDPSIRPYDLVYIADSYLKIYGFVEVEQVVHHFTPDTGFVTTITPNAVVTVKDPARFSVLASSAKKQAIQSVRDRLRRSYEVKIDADSALRDQEEDFEYFKRTASQEIVGTTQFIGGSTSVGKSLIPNAAFQLNAIEELANQESPDTRFRNLASVAGIFDLATESAGADLPDFDFAGLLVTSWWEKIRDNLLDQNACHIHYLNKRGRPMDAGLNFADGVAVGQMSTRDLALWGIELQSSNATTGIDGDSRINLGDVIPQLQYSERLGITEASREVSMFVNQENQLLRQLSGRVGDDQAPGDPSTVRVFLLEVRRIKDADTFEVQAIGQFLNGEFVEGSSLPNGLNTIRLAGVQAPEDPYKAVPAEEREELLDFSRNYGLRASVYTERTMPVGTRFAFRTYEANIIDQFDRVLGHAFHTYPESLTTSSQQEAYMMRTAYQIPLVSYDSFLPDGQPATFDYQLILAGFGDVYVSDLDQNLPGVEGSRE